MNYGVVKNFRNLKIKKKVITKIKLPQKNLKILKRWLGSKVNKSLKKLKVKRNT